MELSLSSNAITSLAGMEGHADLKKLFLFSNQIVDLTTLALLTSLTDLGLSDNKIANISSLSKLAALQFLFLDFNSIRDITTLRDLTALIELDLTANLAHLPQLRGCSYSFH